MSSYDFVVIGAGVFGLSIARSIKINRPELRVLVLEKESEVGKHTSGRNSGVLHQGIYYSPDSLKAKLCIAGAKQIEAFCIEKKLPLKKIGKVILPLKKTDDVELKRLLERAQKNGAKIRLIDQKEITAIEPEAVSLTGFGLHSPETSVIDPLITLNALLEDARSKGVAICFNAPVFNAKPKEKYVELGPEKIPYGHLINASGLFADKVAHIFDVGKNYRLFPFRGIYSKLTENCPLKIRGLIYPVPDLRVPVLGVHFTPSIAGGIYIGPTALPALGRENYRGLEGIESHEFFPMLQLLVEQYFLNKQGFRRFAHQEILHLFKSALVKEAQTMVPKLRTRFVKSSPKVGIRAQLLNLSTRELVMDFLIEKGENSTHILNAVSPGWTSALSFAEFVVKDLL